MRWEIDFSFQRDALVHNTDSISVNLEAQRISLPNVDSMLKEEKRSENGYELYPNISSNLNQLFNLYFNITDERKSLNLPFHRLF